MSGQHCESYDVKRETVPCYPVNSSLLTAVARDGWNLSAVFKFCFCFVLLYNKSLIAPFNNMRTLTFKAQLTKAFFATVNQVFGDSSHLPTTVERAVIKSLSTVQITKQSLAVVGS